MRPQRLESSDYTHISISVQFCPSAEDRKELPQASVRPVFVHPGFPDKKAFIRAKAWVITVKICSTVIKNKKLWSQTNLFSLILAGCVTLGKLLSHSEPCFLCASKITLPRVVILSFKVDDAITVLTRVLINVR